MRWATPPDSPAAGGRRLVAAALIIGGLLALGCAEGGRQDAAAANPLYVDPASRDFSSNPELLERIFASPHGYYRFINLPFSIEVCRRFESALAETPPFNLHGDAHLEQYAVTDLGRGLTDFDDSSNGPAVLDLLRFGVSLDLATRQLGWHDQSDDLFDTFLSAYRSALENPGHSIDEPQLVEEIRSTFTYDRESYLEWVESVTDPMPGTDQQELTAKLQPYVEAMTAAHPDLGADFFTLESIGFLRMGIGSALDDKFLARIRGETADELDDVLVEIKEVRDLAGISCISALRQSHPSRIIVGQSKIAYEPYRFLGYAFFRDKPFWVHAWVDNYREVDIGQSFSSQAQLAELVADIGVQLGRGHANQIDQFIDEQLRREQLRLLERDEAAIKRQRHELADLTVAAWERFKAEFEDG